MNFNDGIGWLLVFFSVVWLILVILERIHIHNLKTKKPMEENRRKTICVDFDGVVHSYKQRWRGPKVIPDDPVPGAIQWLISIDYSKFDVCIFSSRSKYFGGRRAIKRWLFVNGLTEDFIKERLNFPLFKPTAHLIIDDRAMCFQGIFPNNFEMETFQPWNRKSHPTVIEGLIEERKEKYRKEYEALRLNRKPNPPGIALTGDELGGTLPELPEDDRK